jgi:hypothetical protein
VNPYRKLNYHHPEAGQMRKCLAVLAIAVVIALPATAQQVNLSGIWKLDLSSSFMAGDHPAPDYELTKLLVQDGSSIHQTDVAKHVTVMNIPSPDSNVAIQLIADGQEQDAEVPGAFPGMPPAKAKVRAEWQGSTLVVTERDSGNGSAAVTTRRYFLSSDSAHLIELVDAHNSFGGTGQRLVFDK